ncbi:GNAT family N-acetyltransferase [Brevibacterium jeotgali]|uniref:N-acetyltransferase domain-containing protein n=1 Tax=Brevibacterium jeotgali TaxID=1262550 RepID=A0A2H1L4S4_9MICO|nr:GNAT family N-acetyltransferase [Brevibacterium jeotgali]TWC01503.1 hypothetical protein FB108_0149 [Brevibacterium jeotgali]SMY11892.1 hypothetical protein BJEO58_01484 [Brevibacterium jeotgali]
MTDQQLTDKTGAAVTVALDQERRAYAITLDSGEVAGRTFFTPASATEDSGGAEEWIFFHTEVDDSFGGRGLGGILVGQAMADVAERGVTVVPLCPFVKGWLEKNEDAYASQGGTVRRAGPSDVDAAQAASKGA